MLDVQDALAARQDGHPKAQGAAVSLPASNFLKFRHPKGFVIGPVGFVFQVDQGRSEGITFESHANTDAVVAVIA